MMEVRPIQQQPAALTAEGLAPCTASLAAVPEELRPLLDAAAASYRRCLGARLLGVYVRGSLVQPGCFVPGVSDADFLALVAGGGGGTAGGDEGVAITALLAQQAADLQRAFPQCVKVELKTVSLPPASPLATLARRQPASVPPSALVGAEGLCFLLKTQAVCLHGWDLPAVLSEVAAMPPLQLLPSLVEDVEAAMAAARQRLAAGSSSGGSADSSSSTSTDGSSSRSGVARAAAAVRWALKRCVRAAFELHLCCADAGGAGSSGRVFSRDLFWCQQYAAAQHPELAPQLEAALRLYVQLSASSSSASSSDESSGSGVVRRQQVESGVRLAQQLAAAVDATFLSRMLAEEPGWLEHHREPASSTSTSGGSSTGSGGASWARQLRLKLWLAGAAAAGSTLEADLRGWPPPPVTAPVTGSVLTLDWRLPEQRERALAVIAAGVNCSSGSSGSSGGLPGQTQPVLLKGAAAHWPAVQRWTLAGLAAAGLEGRARLAPSLQFPFTEPRLAALLAEQRGPAALPSAVARMSAAEFAARLARGNPCSLPPLVYGAAGGDGGGDEYLYWQAELPPALLSDVDLAPLAPPGERQSQAARVWVGPQGAVSPTHYDTSLSFLAQARGRKRMLFWPPDQLPCLYCYPDTHLLRRRSRLNMHAPWEEQARRFPLAARLAATEAVLEPGDVVVFPSRWAHYTEGLSFNMSLTWRYGAAGSGPAAE